MTTTRMRRTSRCRITSRVIACHSPECKGVQVRNGVDTFAVPEWRMTSVIDRAPDKRGRGATAHSVALMETVLVVVAHEAVQRALEREATREVPTAKDHAPVLLQDAALQPLDEAVEVADVEGVQAHKLARLFRLDVPGAAVAGAPQALASTFRQQPGRTRRLTLEHGQPSASGGQPDPAQQPLHRAGRQADPPGPGEVGRDPSAPPGGRADRDREHQPLHFGRRRHRTPRLGALPARVHAVDPITFQPLAPAIEDGPRDPQLAAHRADVALHLRALDDAQAHPVYALVEGHRSVLPQWFPWPGTHSGNDKADGLLLRSREVSTLLRVRTA